MLLFQANPPVGKDQPPDLAALVPSDTTNIKEVMEKTTSLKIDEAVNSKPASVTGIIYISQTYF